MAINSLLLFIKDAANLSSPTLVLEKVHTDETGTYYIYKCKENSKFYFTHLQRDCIINSELDKEAILQFGLE